MNKKIISPCISICKTDPRSGFCYGCARTDEEKKIWKISETSNEWKNKNLLEIQSRMSGWQLDTFKDSYKNKIREGISIYKKQCNCRKPKNKLVKDILEEWDIDIKNSFMIGDKISDQQCAKKSNIYFEFRKKNLFNQTRSILSKFY